MAWGNKSNGERQDRGAEQSRRGNQSDPCRIESDFCQIDRKHDSGKAIAKTAQCAGAIEEQEAVTWIQRIAFVLMMALQRGAAPRPTGFIVRFQLLAFAILSSAARKPLASLIASSFAQKCMK